MSAPFSGLPHTDRTRPARIWLARAVSVESSRLGTSSCTVSPGHAPALRNPWCGADRSRHCRSTPGLLRPLAERLVERLPHTGPHTNPTNVCGRRTA